MMDLKVLARRARELIAAAEADGVVIDDGNVVDLVADNVSRVSLNHIRDALVVAGLAQRVPRATSYPRTQD